MTTLTNLFAASAGAVELRNSLMQRYSLELPSTVTFDYPTVPALANYLVSLMPAEGGGAEEDYEDEEEGSEEEATAVDVSAIQ